MGIIDRLLGRDGEAGGGPVRVAAIVDGVVVAESDQTIKVEGNHYFPPDSVRWEHFTETDRHTVCPWKGLASYYDVQAGEKRLRSAAWTYHDPSNAAARIAGHVAFYGHKVEVRRTQRPTSGEGASP